MWYSDTLILRFQVHEDIKIYDTLNLSLFAEALAAGIL